MLLLRAMAPKALMHPMAHNNGRHRLITFLYCIHCTEWGCKWGVRSTPLQDGRPDNSSEMGGQTIVARWAVGARGRGLGRSGHATTTTRTTTTTTPMITSLNTNFPQNVTLKTSPTPFLMNVPPRHSSTIPRMHPPAASSGSRTFLACASD